MKIRSWLTLLAVTPLVAFGAGSVGTTAIKTVDVEGYLGFVAIFGSFANNPDSCGSSSLVIVRKTDAWYTDTYALTVASLASGTPMNFYVSGCYATPWGYTAPIVQSAQMNP